jgi:SNF2 family DNA or RNA helicase
MINRYSSRISKLDEAFLNKKLSSAISYDRIAGYFSTSILEIAGEAIENIEGNIRIVCNSELKKTDFISLSTAHNNLRKEWCSFNPEEKFNGAKARLLKLYELIKSKKLQIKVIPNDVFGLIHGKAGVITFKDGTKTAFIGSLNETFAAWKLNYEILWEDNSDDAVQWVEDEFNYFWTSPYAIPLSEFVIEDIKRIAERTVVSKREDWKKKDNPASAVIELPVYRRDFGLWEHQKYFAKLAFKNHKKHHCARFVLADVVGLGKTVELAIAAQLMILYGGKPVLVIVPKNLIWQWQDELNNLLDIPSAVWTGKEWIDENGFKYPCNNDNGIRKCPRKIGIISQGLITAKSESVTSLFGLNYECIIIDEAHRARRRNLGPDKENEKPEPNNLMRFALEISKKTKSMLLATATPVQLYPVEAWDLLYILSQANDSIMGNKFSNWRRDPAKALNLIMEKEKADDDLRQNWEWIRNPFPPSEEDVKNFGVIRDTLNLKENQSVIMPEDFDNLRKPDLDRLQRLIDDGFFIKNNPFIRHIVRRRREKLENTINPETGEPYLKPIKVILHGENDYDAIELPPYLYEAYKRAMEFSELLKQRLGNVGGFIKTLLLRRVGSTIIAGQKTAENMLKNWSLIVEESKEDEAELGLESLEGEISTDDNNNAVKEKEKPKKNKNKTSEYYEKLKVLTPNEKECLERFVKSLESNTEKDPKFQLVKDLLEKGDWLRKGCIIFSQYFDSAKWIAENLSNEMKEEKIGLYAGGDKSGFYLNGVFIKKSKETIKKMVKDVELRLLVGTDSASEGLNLQALSTLINLDLPWNPTRLEQRKGRIQRIGQASDEIHIYNMRYKDSVEDRVHSILSERLENIYGMFGQIPDVLEDVWINVAVNEIEKAKQLIDAIPKKHPFEIRYQENIGNIDWESCSEVLDNEERKKFLMQGWDEKNE